MTLTNFPNGVSSFGVPVLGGGGIPATSGNIFWVDSATGAAGNDGSAGAPEATIDAAIALCTANHGDVILIKPGHSETLAAVITCDIAGVTIQGLGEGLTRPQITVGAVIDGFNVTAADVILDNLYFNEATAAATSNINVAAARCTLRRIHMDAGANDVDVITVTAAGELLTVEDCTGLITANGPDTWVKFEGVVDRPIIRRNHIVGSDGTNAYDDGVIDFNSQAVTNPMVYGNLFNGADQATTVVANGGSVTGASYGPNVYAGSATDADNIASITSVTLAADAIGAAEIAAAAIDAATFATDALQAMQDEAEDALEGENLDHLAAVTTAAADMTTEVVDGSILSRLLSKTSDTSSYDPTTDALEMASDKLGAFSGDGGANQDDSAKASLDLLHTAAGSPDDATTDSVQGKLGTDTELADRSLYDLLNGGGPAAAATAAAPTNDVSIYAALRAIYNLSVPTVATGETVLDEGDYDWSADYPALLTIAPAAGAPLADVRVQLDLAKVTTGYSTTYDTETISLYVERKLDGTNWRRGAIVEAAITGTAAADRMVDINVGDVGVTEQVRVVAALSAEQDGTSETDIPYAVSYKALGAPTITPLTATP